MPPKFRRRLLYYLPRVRYFIFGGLAGLLLLGLFRILPSTFRILQNLSLGSSIAWSFVTNQPIAVKSTDGRTNILLLGIAGGDHEGPNLSDTMIFASLDLKKQDLLTVSIPRDIWVDSLKNKINSSYALGEEKKKGGGLILSRAVVSDLLGQPIHYVIVMDFSGFKKVIDLLGGLDLDVEKTFDDYRYPVDGKENDPCDGDPEYLCRYEHLHFDQGFQHIDGERALKYVRSRHAEGDEGTDFARSKRQQKVLANLKEKILSRETLLNPGKLLTLEKIFQENVVTDIQSSEIDDFLKIIKKQNLKEIRTAVLDSGDKEKGREGLLVNPSADQYDGAWVLVPRTGSWQEIQKYLDSQIKTPANIP